MGNLTVSSFNEQPYPARLHALGDISEEVFEQAHPLGPAERYGWNRPQSVQVRHMPQVVRNQPDYYTASNHFVEVMGVGRDGIVKGMKTHKWESYKIWKKIATLMGVSDLLTFVWNSDTEEYVLLSYEQVKNLVTRARKKGTESFNDGNEYYPIPWSWMVETVNGITGAWHLEH